VMEKKEARIKCSGCGTSYKLKIPVTEKPVSFKCKKCGKVLKIRIKGPEPQTTATPPEPERPISEMPEFETTQLPETGDYHDVPAPPGSLRTPSAVESHFFAQAVPQPPPSDDVRRRWLMLSDEMVRGPYTDEEIVSMIHNGEITAETSLRMGERPWVKAVEISNFRELFPPSQRASRAPLAAITLLDKEPQEADHEGPVSGRPFYAELPAVIPYPVAQGQWQPLAIFAGITFVLSALLTLEFFVGLLLNLIGWALLFGYLLSVMQQSKNSPQSPPPEWDFPRAKNMIVSGAKVLAVFLVYSLVPVTIFLLLMMAFFLNDLAILGYVFMLLTVLVYAASLFVLPAALLVMGNTEEIGDALNPGKALSIVKSGGQPYQMLAVVSLAAGIACMLVTLLAVFLVDIPIAGFIIAGVLMAAVFSYGHFIWFHVLGRFSRENPNLMGANAVPA
jgi:hypothetical protein